MIERSKSKERPEIGGGDAPDEAAPATLPAREGADEREHDAPADAAAARAGEAAPPAGTQGEDNKFVLMIELLTASLRSLADRVEPATRRLGDNGGDLLKWPDLSGRFDPPAEASEHVTLPRPTTELHSESSDGIAVVKPAGEGSLPQFFTVDDTAPAISAATAISDIADEPQSSEEITRSQTPETAPASTDVAPPPISAVPELASSSSEGVSGVEALGESTLSPDVPRGEVADLSGLAVLVTRAPGPPRLAQGTLRDAADTLAGGDTTLAAPSRPAVAEGAAEDTDAATKPVAIAPQRLSEPAGFAAAPSVEQHGEGDRELASQREVTEPASAEWAKSVESAKSVVPVPSVEPRAGPANEPVALPIPPAEVESPFGPDDDPGDLFEPVAEAQIVAAAQPARLTVAPLDLNDLVADAELIARPPLPIEPEWTLALRVEPGRGGTKTAVDSIEASRPQSAAPVRPASGAAGVTPAVEAVPAKTATPPPPPVTSRRRRAGSAASGASESRSAANDPLAPLRALSEEELIALFS